jgi:hypothetical protein
MVSSSLDQRGGLEMSQQKPNPLMFLYGKTDGLIEVLKEKGILTEEDVHKITRHALKKAEDRK